MKPFLKWVGGKYRIRDKIIAHLPAGSRLIEPFVGAGSIFLNTEYKHYILADINHDLINIYKHLKAEQQKFINYCAKFFTIENNNEKIFLNNREIFNTTTNKRLKAGLFLYLNRHSYNGLIRYNSKGQLNMPFGYYKKPYFPKKEMLYFANKVQDAKICQADFVTTIQQAKAGDVIYCDPPYVPLSKTANFTQYNLNSFGESQQIALANIVKKIVQQGVIVLISNHDTNFIQQLYQGAKIKKFEVQRFISCKVKNRTKAKEILAIFT